MVTSHSVPSSQDQGLRFNGPLTDAYPDWSGSMSAIAFDPAAIQRQLLALDQPCYCIWVQGQVGVTHEPPSQNNGSGDRQIGKLLLSVPPLSIQQLGDPEFQTCHNVKYAYMAGAMAGGIASEELVIALGQERILSAFGAGGLSLDRVEAAINRIQQHLPQGPYAFNLLHNPNDQAQERSLVDLYLRSQVKTVEASAFLDLTSSLVYYRAAGLAVNQASEIQINHKVIAKLSRKEVATKFLQPAPSKILKALVNQGLITELQAKLAAQVPMADDLTVEADSGGHTDNRPLVCLLPAIMALRNQIQAQYQYQTPVRVGAAGGIATPESTLAALMMGAAYIVTGSINQACVEAGTCQHIKQLLSQADMADVSMAPAADMFEMGVKVQVLKRGTMFPIRAQKLFELYRSYDSIDQIPQPEREKIETQIFRKSLEAVWQNTVEYLQERNPEKLARAAGNPKLKMALIFRWYLGLSSRWSSLAEKGREIDYQIWCGPAMGSFNDWVRGSYLTEPQHRHVVDIANQLMRGAAFLYRLQSLKLQGLQFPAQYCRYHPVQELS